MCVGVNSLLTIDFEGFASGTEITNNVGYGFNFSAVNAHPSHPDKLIIFDSNCPGGCSGGDSDLRTPGSGPGNDTAQGNLIIIA